MLEIKASQSGDFDFITRRLEAEEKKYYGIFISHASSDNEKYLFPLRDAMYAKDLHPLCDRDFLSGGDEFQMRIEKNLDCYAAVIIITNNSLGSNWVNYEIGILTGRNIPIYLWDPEGVLSSANKNSDPFIDFIYDSHIGQYLPAYQSMDELLAILAQTSPYSEMFCEENAFLDCATFRSRVAERVETVIATLESEIFDTHYADFSACKFGMLVPNFGMFYPNHGDGEHCYARRYMPIENRTCPISGTFCALSAARTLSEENKECVLINHVLYNGRLLKRNDLDRRGKRIECGCVEFHLPLHKLYGTEFKFIIDVSDNLLYSRLMNVLEYAGMNPSSSLSMFGGRIYLSLPERRSQGLFRLDHEFTNNFLCPHAGRSK